VGPFSDTGCILKNIYEDEKELNTKGLEGNLLQVDTNVNKAREVEMKRHIYEAGHCP
jgi:hypothetical protein